MTGAARAGARERRAARGPTRFAALRENRVVRWLVARPTVSAALLFALFVFAYLWPVLVGGKILSPISLLYGVSPWTNLVPEDVQGYVNGLLSDVPTADYPWRYLVRELLHEGTFPAWNPYVFAGTPLFTNPQTGLFSLFSLPLWILPLNYGIGVGAALKLWAAAFGTYLLVRELRLGFLPGLLAGVCFSFSAINIVWLTHETLPAVAALLPWMLWLVERIFQRGGGLASLLGLAAATAIGLGGGHPGMQVHLLAATGVYAVLRACVLPGPWAGSAAVRERLRPLGFAFGGLALGTMLMGAMLVPEMLSSRGTIGTIARSHGRGTLPGTEMPFTTIRTVLFPDWWGDPSGRVVRGPVTSLSESLAVEVNYNERTFYPGAVGLLLALVGVAAGGGWRRRGPFLVLAALGLAIPLHFPGLYQLVTHLPAFELVQNQRLHFVFALGVAVLAAFGLQAVLERPAGDRWRLAVGLGALGVGVVAFAGAGASGSDVSDTLTHFVQGTDFESAGVLALTSVVWFALFACAVALALLAARRWPGRVAAVGAVVVLLGAADMLHFAHGYQPMAPPSRAIPPETPAIAFLKAHRDEGRIVGIGNTLPNDWSLIYGLHDIRGYDPPQPTLRYYRLWQRANPRQLNWMSFAIEELTPEALQVISQLGARWIIAPPGTEVPSEAEGGPLGGLRQVYDGDDARIFENPRAMTRAIMTRI